MKIYFKDFYSIKYQRNVIALDGDQDEFFLRSKV